jgi:hypothetical protein
MAQEIEEALRAFLVTLDAVTALTAVGTTGDYRIRPDRLEEDDDERQEHVIIEVDQERPQNDLSGKGGLVYADVTLRCRGPTKKRARALAEAVRVNGTDPGTGLAGYEGAAGELAIGAVLEDQQASESPAGDGSDRRTYDVFCSYEISFSEAT